MRGDGPRSAGDLLTELFRRKGMGRSMKRAEVVLLWPRIVGRDVARFSSARAFTNGILVVDVTDSETAMHLAMQRQRFVAAYHDTYGLKEVRDIRFQAGRVAAEKSPDDEPDDRGASEPAAEAGPLEGALEAASLPPDVAESARAAARSLASHWARQRAAGHQPCPTCGVLHDGALTPPLPRERRMAETGRTNETIRDHELCPSCRRSAREPRVIAAARRLALSPGEMDPGLSYEEVQVATRSARFYLEDMLNDLLPRAVADPSTRTHLELAARCLAALVVGKDPDDLTDADMHVLDERVARYLGWSWS
ncbi:MAG TPA: DUF721 domain-containing protein [Trueperaceae bacterium]